MIHKKTVVRVAALVSILIVGGVAFGQPKGHGIEKEIKFARGSSSATVKGVVETRLDSHIYHLKAKAGQTLTVRMVSSKPLRDAYLGVGFPLNSSGNDESVYGKRYYKIKLPRDGDYEVYIEAIRDNIDYTIRFEIH